MDRRPDHRGRGGMRPHDGRGIRRPGHRPDAPIGPQGITDRGPRPHATPLILDQFRPICVNTKSPAEGPQKGLAGELPANRPNRLNWPKRAKTGINRRFRRNPDLITFGFEGITSGFWGITSGFWGITSGICGITSGFFTPQIQLKAFKTRGRVFQFGPFQIRIRAVHPIL